MKHLLTTFIFIGIAIFCVGQNTVTNLKFPTPEEYAKYPAINIEVLKQKHSKPQFSPPSFSGSVFLTTATPQNQGVQGSCTAWATAYAALTTLGYDKFGQNINAAMRSPSFVFNSIMSDESKKYYEYSTYSAVRFVAENGSCSLNSMKYDQYDFKTKPNNNQKFEAGLNTCKYGAIHEINNINKYREILYYGHPIVVSFLVTNEFDRMWSSDGIWNNLDTTGIRGGHAACIVGYDDTKQMFKVMNSWGSNNGDNGFFWVTYDLVQQKCFYEAYVLYDITPDKEPSISNKYILCDNLTATIKNLPTGATTEWTNRLLVYPNERFPDIYITKIDEETAEVTRGYIINTINNKYELFTGTTTINATIKLKNGISKTFSKEIKATTPPKPNIYEPTLSALIRIGEITKHKLQKEKPLFTHDLFVYTITWNAVAPNGEITYLGKGSEVTYKPKYAGKHAIIATNIDGCGSNRSDTTYIEVAPDYIILHPNPINSNSFDIKITTQNNEPSTRVCTTNSNYTNTQIENFYIEIASETNGIIKRLFQKTNENTINITIEDLHPGTYIIRLLKDNQLLATSTLIVTL